MSSSRDPKSYSAATGMIREIIDRHLRIMIVDDSDPFRKSMKFFLSRKYGATVAEVGSGWEAVELLACGTAFDLVIIDLVMPGMSGIETYAQIKAIDASCPMVIMSAFLDSKGWEETGKEGVIVLSKPIPTETMTQLLFDAATMALKCIPRSERC